MHTRDCKGQAVEVLQPHLDRMVSTITCPECGEAQNVTVRGVRIDDELHYEITLDCGEHWQPFTPPSPIVPVAGAELRPDDVAHNERSAIYDRWMQTL